MKNPLLAVCLGLLLTLGSCYPDEIVSDDELDIVLTYEATGVDFSQYQTYSMPDEVLVDPDGDGISDVLENQILQSIQRNMTLLGYARVTDPTAPAPDLILFPELIISQNYASGGCYGCWGWYDPWYPGWGGGYYYPPSYVVSYKTGTINLTLIDVDATHGNQDNADALWISTINGLANASTARVSTLIDQAFDQSPYLNIK